MRILLAVPSLTVRLHNLVPLGWALRASGHEVQIAGHPDFTPTINYTGFVAVSVGGKATEGHPYDQSADDLVTFAELWRPDIVIWDEHVPSAAVAARHVKAVSVRMFGPFPSVHDPAEVAERMAPDLTRHELEPDHDLFSGLVTLSSLPPSLRTAAELDWRQIRHVPYSGPTQIPAWMRRKVRRRRVLLNLADGAVGQATLLDAVAGIDAEVIGVLDPERLPTDARIPDNVRVVDSVPTAALLAGCVAVVHDDVESLAADALVHGVPQLVLAEEDPSPLVRRIVEAEAGVRVSPSNESFTKEIDRVVNDELLRERVGHIQDEILAMPSPGEALPDLVRLSA